jgi:hypothetical protein
MEIETLFEKTLRVSFDMNIKGQLLSFIQTGSNEVTISHFDSFDSMNTFNSMIEKKVLEATKVDISNAYYWKREDRAIVYFGYSDLPGLFTVSFEIIDNRFVVIIDFILSENFSSENFLDKIFSDHDKLMSDEEEKLLDEKIDEMLDERQSELIDLELSQKPPIE